MTEEQRENGDGRTPLRADAFRIEAQWPLLADVFLARPFNLTFSR